MRQKSLAVVIPTAGPGRRMKTYGAKALIQLPDGRTLVRRQIDVVRQLYPRAEILVVVGFEGDKVSKHLPAGVRVVENEFYDETGPGRSVAMGLRATSADACLVVYGDLVFNRATLEGLPLDRSGVVVDTGGRLPADGVGLTVDGGVVTHFDYGLPAKWCHVSLLTGRELHLFKSVGAQPASRRKLGFEVMNEVVDRGGVFHAYECEDMRLVEVDSAKDVKKAREVVS